MDNNTNTDWPGPLATGPLLRPNQRQNNNNPFIIILFCCFAALHTQIESLAVSRGLTLSYTATVSLYSPLPTLSYKCIPPNKWRFISFLTASIIQPRSFIIRIINILIGPINQNKKGGMCLEIVDSWPSTLSPAWLCSSCFLTSSEPSTWQATLSEVARHVGDVLPFSEWRVLKAARVYKSFLISEFMKTLFENFVKQLGC